MKKIQSFVMTEEEMRTLSNSLEYAWKNDNTLDQLERQKVKILLRDLQSQLPAEPCAISNTLTYSEHKIFTLLLKGVTNIEIAKTLYISANTVKSHTKNIYNKLGVENRVDLIIKYKNVEGL
ncbi:helix-turn-helix transcriptional regulator [Bacillus sp. SB49]|uniref:response regulator transcription factor n=1 Tax=Bacillaceae TaxID=186817 RepID=UPI000416A9C6|nr:MULTISPECIES: LuxR C-terminal-related transcriptional regulator [Bacillaceae]QHT46122.1 helix-turn-helix transcriptional regulator [Bacillus sp. SB49]